MEKLKNEVVKDVTTKKKYVKPDFEVIDLEDTPKLLAGSADVNSAARFRTISRDENNW
jgi:hypothetical protein